MRGAGLKFRCSARCEALDQSGCVEVANVSGGVVVRDSTDRGGPVVMLSRRVWRRVAAAVRVEEVR